MLAGGQLQGYNSQCEVTMRYLVSLFLTVIVLGNCACDNFQIIGAINTGTFCGTVTIVRLTADNNGTQVTFVTLVNGPTSKDYGFCGNVVSQFPINSVVQGSFTAGTACSTIVRITISG